MGTDNVTTQPLVCAGNFVIEMGAFQSKARRKRASHGNIDLLHKTLPGGVQGSSLHRIDDEVEKGSGQQQP